MEHPPDLSRQRMMVNLTIAPGYSTGVFGSLPSGQILPDGSFTINGVIPGKYVLRGSFGMAKSAVANGQDTLDVPLDFTGDRDVTDAVITVTDKISELSGVLTDNAGKPAADYTVVAASAEEKYWTPGSRRIQIARPTPDGRYSFRALPPGEYLLGAVMELEGGGQYDPEFLKSLSTGLAMRITVTDGGKVTQDLRIVR